MPGEPRPVPFYQTSSKMDPVAVWLATTPAPTPTGQAAQDEGRWRVLRYRKVAASKARILQCGRPLLLQPVFHSTHYKAFETTSKARMCTMPSVSMCTNSRPPVPTPLKWVAPNARSLQQLLPGISFGIVASEFYCLQLSALHYKKRLVSLCKLSLLSFSSQPSTQPLQPQRSTTANAFITPRNQHQPR